jgi:hypothetical protein
MFEICVFALLSEAKVKQIKEIRLHLLIFSKVLKLKRNYGKDGAYTLCSGL